MATLNNTLINDTGSIKLASGTTASRPASPTAGMVRFNTSVNVAEYYDGSNWRAIDGKVRAGFSNATETSYGPFTILTYFADGTFSPTHAGYVDVLVVGAGGAGGGGIGGGGGAGGVVQAYSIPVTPQTYTIQVGVGGTGGTGLGNNGEDSSAFGIIGAGGGTSGRHAGTAGTAGGSGGGGASTNDILAQGGGTTGNSLNGYPGIIYGSEGGDQLYARTASACRAAGGGGAGGPGHDVDGRTGSSTLNDGRSDGGTGIKVLIDGLDFYYGGGGGGGGYTGNERAGCGGAGGGGAGAQNTASENAKGGRFGRNVPADAQGVGFDSSNDPAGTPGGANTGGGGGGGAWDAGVGGNGGSGIVIIRYLK